MTRRRSIRGVPKFNPKLFCSHRPAVLRDNVFSAVLEILPAPLSSSELRSVKILTLKYGDARRACAAFRILEGHKEVTSVEFDGAVPKCGEEL